MLPRLKNFAHLLINLKSSLNISLGEPAPGALEKSTGIIAIFTFPVEEFQGRGGNPFAPPPNEFLVSRRAQVARGAEADFQLSLLDTCGGSVSGELTWVDLIWFEVLASSAEAVVVPVNAVASVKNKLSVI
jgi:hypothetical protein